MNRKILTIVILIVLISFSTCQAGISYTEGKQSYFTKEEISKTKNPLLNLKLNLLMKLSKLPSLSACIIKDDEVVWSNGFGFYDLENKKKATDNTIYLICSITKSITATALLQLYDQGLFDLDDDVNNYLSFSLRNPNHPDDPITFRMLLAHQSSINSNVYCNATGQYYIGDYEIPSYPYPWLMDYLTPNGSLYSPEVWTGDKPGEKMHYSGIGYCLCGYLIELISGQKYKDYCKDHIFEPLQMYNTSFNLSDLNLDNVAIHYTINNSGLITTYDSHEHFTLLPYPGGGLRSSVSDLSHFLIAHMNNGVYKGLRLLNESTVNEMHKVQYYNDEVNYRYGTDFQYGFGWLIRNRPFIKDLSGHTGAYELGARTKMLYRPSKNTGIIYFTNTLPKGRQFYIWEYVIEKVLFRYAEKL